MPNIKYYCPKCGKKFVEWGAQKFGFKCPHCKDSVLQKIGISDDQIILTPKPRKRPRLMDEDSDKEIDFPEEYLEEEIEDYDLAQVDIEEEEIAPEDELHAIEEAPEEIYEEEEIPPEEDLDIEEE